MFGFTKYFATKQFTAKHSLCAAVILVVSVPFTIAQQPPGPTSPIQPKTTPPDSGLPQLQLPDQAILPANPAPQASQAVEDRIRNALSGDAKGGTGDPVLDDILGVLKNRGSILKGSLLDVPDPDLPKKAAGKGNPYRAAEALLRASRVLEKLGDLNESQTELIKEMRNESARLLSPKKQN